MSILLVKINLSKTPETEIRWIGLTGDMGFTFNVYHSPNSECETPYLPSMVRANSQLITFYSSVLL